MAVTSYKAIVLTEPGPEPKYELQELPLPALGPSDVLVKLSATGVCGTDLGLAAGALGPTQSILGHEGVGRIVKLGSAVANDPSIRIGQRTGVSWIRDVCEQIHSGRKVDGTFGQYTVVPSRYLIPLPDGPSDEQLAPILCAGVTAYKALKLCAVSSEQWVGVIGSGGAVGSMALQYAKAMGYRTVAIDAGAEKGRISRDHGADEYIDVLQIEDVPAAVASITGGHGVAAALAIAGKASAYKAALHSIAPFGTLVCVGIPPLSEEVSFHPLLLIDKGIRIIGSAVGTRDDIREAVELLVSGKVVPDVQVIEFDKLISVLDPKCANQGAKYVVRIP